MANFGMWTSIRDTRILLLCALQLTTLLASPSLATWVSSPHPASRRLQATAAKSPPQVEQAVAFARTIAESSVGQARKLLAAVESGSLAASKAAYVDMRPGYEQVEHLYEVLGDIDRDIDARPDVFDYGEAYVPALVGTPGAIFKGSHRIETLLYRDGNATAAVPWARQLVVDYGALAKKLQNSSEFSSPQIFAGLIEVAREVAKKKISSEEETWSDLSILIFYNNLKGIAGMFEPWAKDLAVDNSSAADEMNRTLTAAFAALAPYVRTATNGSHNYAPYSTVPTAARRKIQTAFYDVAESLQQAATIMKIGVLPLHDEGEALVGAAVLAGPHHEDEEVCTPTVNLTVFNGDSPEIRSGRAYFQALLPYQMAASKRLTAAVASGNVSAARAAYAATRPMYEQIEVLAVSFPETDMALDAREYAFAEGERSDDFTGFHRLERLIMGDGDVGPATLEYAKGVEENLAILEVALESTDPSRFTAATAFQGMHALATEVAAKKISSEEETSSDLSLMIYYNNWKGILSQALPFCPRAPAQCTAFVKAVKAAAQCLGIDTKDVIENVGALVVNDTFAAGLLNANYKRYSNATMEQRRCIVRRGYAVRDKLAEFANAIGVVDDCSPVYEASFVTYPSRALEPKPPGGPRAATKATESAAPTPSPTASAATAASGLMSHRHAVLVTTLGAAAAVWLL